MRLTAFLNSIDRQREDRGQRIAAFPDIQLVVCGSGYGAAALKALIRHAAPGVLNDVHRGLCELEAAREREQNDPNSFTNRQADLDRRREQAYEDAHQAEGDRVRRLLGY
jgi:hypothetical protein